jgi:hypothetical protein
MHLHVDPESTGAAIRYDRWGIEVPIALDTSIDWLKVHVDIGLGVLLADEDLSVVDTVGDTVFVRSDRTITSGRLGLGPAFIPVEGLYIAPYFAAAIGGMRSRTTITPRAAMIAGVTSDEQALLGDWSTRSWSVAGVVDAQYLRWLREERRRLDFRMQYALVYSETFGESLPLLQTSGLTNTLTGEIVLRTITDVRVRNRRLAWNVFTTAAGFPGRELDDLGATYTFGFGLGLDLYFPEQILGALQRSFVGVRGSGLVGNHNHGWSVMLQIQR